MPQQEIRHERDEEGVLMMASASATCVYANFQFAPGKCYVTCKKDRKHPFKSRDSKSY